MSLQLDRCLALTRFERSARERGFVNVAGIDEAGRGPLAGPVVAAACILPDTIYFEGIDDSKKLSSARREELYQAIVAAEGVVYAIASVAAEIIDQINIFKATLAAMQAAVEKLQIKPNYILVDGKHLPPIPIPGEAIVRGDSRSQSIMAAAILAKVTRDRIMVSFHEKWPEYGFSSHKGYGTAEHLRALQKHGRCPIHRKSFKPDAFKI